MYNSFISKFNLFQSLPVKTTSIKQKCHEYEGNGTGYVSLLDFEAFIAMLMG
jgi:hypothetical protein